MIRNQTLKGKVQERKNIQINVKELLLTLYKLFQFLNLTD
jgi:hypothetical protein